MPIESGGADPALIQTLHIADDTDDQDTTRQEGSRIVTELYSQTDLKYDHAADVFQKWYII